MRKRLSALCAWRDVDTLQMRLFASNSYGKIGALWVGTMETWARRTTQAHPETPAEGSTLAIVYSSKRDAPDNVLYRAKVRPGQGSSQSFSLTKNRRVSLSGLPRR